MAGNSISISWTVTNTGASARTFGVGAEIDQSGTTLAQTGQTYPTPTIVPGGTASGSFTFTIPAGWSSGTYTAHTVVWSGAPGSSTYLNPGDRDFTVQAQVTNATISVASIPAVVAGSQITISYTVTNTGNYARTFGVGAEIDQSGTTLAQVGQTYPTSTIVPGGTASGSFTFTIPAGWSSGTYTAHTVVWSGAPGSSTYLNPGDRNFTVQAQVTNATISVASIPAAVAGSQITISYTVTNTGNYARTFGVGAEIDQSGTTLAQVGQTYPTSTIVPGGTASGSFTFTIPAGWSSGNYTAHTVVWSGAPGSSTYLNPGDRNFTVQAQVTNATISVASIPAAVAGSQITISYTVTNTGNYARTFGVGAEIEHGGATPAQVGQDTTPALNPGYTASGSFPFTVPGDWPSGTDTARAAVWTGSPGSSTWLNSQDQLFGVQQAPLTLQGRLAYHTYSNYLAAPVDASDGQIYLFTLPNGSLRDLTLGLPVQNAMNPNISPDGSRVVFMAIPQGQPRARTSLEIYVYDLAQERLVRLTNNSVPDEDPKFSPDGQRIVFKENGQLNVMNADGTNIGALTTDAGEKSGPNFSPDGTRIVFWYNASSAAEIGLMQASALNSDVVLLSEPNVEEMYPIFRDNDTFLYTRWDNANSPDDHIYMYSMGASTATRLPLNQDGSNDSDPFPVGISYVGFSSTRSRSGAKGGYDIYISSLNTGNVYQLPGMNDPLQNLGGWYTPFSYARELAVLTPTPGGQYNSASTVVLSVRAYSNGGVWSGASPKLVLQGPASVEYTNLNDAGTNGDAVAGDGIYSSSVVLPPQPGAYTLYSSAISIDNGTADEIRSAPLSITILAVPLALTVSPQVHRDSVAQGATALRPDSASVTLTGTNAGTTGWVATHHGSRATWLSLVDSTGTGSGELRWRRNPTGLAVGLYVDTLTVSAGALSDTVLDSLRIVAPLALAVSPQVHADSVAQGATALRPDSASVTLTGTNAGTTGWVATHHGSRATWLSLVDSTGTGRGELRWRRNPTGLAIGVYVDTLSVTAGTLTAAVLDSLRIVPLALAVSPQVHRDSVAQGATALRPDSASVALTGTNAATTSWVATHHGSRATWLSLVDSTGTGSGMLRWQRNPAGLSIGAYVDTLTLSAGALSATVLDSFRIVAPLALTVSPLLHRDSVAQGATALRPDSASVTFTGTNAGTTGWVATHHGSRATWLSLVDSTGTGSGELRWRRNPTGLAVGLYVDTLTVSAGTVTAAVVDSFRIVLPTALAVIPASRADSVLQGIRGARVDSAQVVLTGESAENTGWVATRGGENWLTLTLTVGSGSGWVRWSRVATGLATGWHVDTVTVASGTLRATLIDSLHVFPPPVSVTEAVNAALGQGVLSAADSAYLDAIGNQNGHYDLGDLLALLNLPGIRVGSDVKVHIAEVIGSAAMTRRVYR